MPATTTVISDLLEASAGLAGLALVFLGMIATATASREAGEKKLVARRASRPVYAVMLAFVAGIFCVAVAAIWLVTGRHVTALYAATIVLFFTQLWLLISATTWVVRQLLKR